MSVDAAPGHLISRVVAGLARFGCDGADALGFAPGRVNLIGDHTDYNGGLAMPAALDLGCVAAAAWGGEPGTVRVHAADLDASVTVPVAPESLGAGLDAVPGWARYIGGVTSLGSALLSRDLTRGVSLSVASSVPIGGGLSSSAAIEVATATALEALVDRAMSPLEKARWCQEAEHRFAGTPCGLLDQLASIHGRAGHGMVVDFAELTVRVVSLPISRARFVLLDTCVSHENSSGGYAQRRAGCEQVASSLGLAHLAQASLDRLGEVSGALSADVVGYARHVITETARVRAFEAASSDGDLELMGRIMRESHASMAGDFNASDPVVDRVVEAACGVAGVYGARMTGGGFGGYVVALVSADGVDETVARLEAAVGERAGVSSRPLVIGLGDGARVLDPSEWRLF